VNEITENTERKKTINERSRKERNEKSGTTMKKNR
jgi:hypothetical protein